MPSPLSRKQPTDIANPRSTGTSPSSIQLPLDSPPSDFDEAVQKLADRPQDELQRAQAHHRRALKALRDDAYEALPDSTRERLIRRLQTNLTALNEALEMDRSDDSSSRAPSSLFHKALTWLW